MARAIGVKVDGLRDVTDRMSQVAQRAGDLRPVLPRAENRLRQGVARKYASGRGWRRLSAGTLANKRRLGQPATPLVANGRLRASLTRPSHPDQVVERERYGLRFGTTVYYARFHRSGADNRVTRKGRRYAGSLPKRTPISVDKPTRLELRKLLEGWVLEGRS